MNETMNEDDVHVKELEAYAIVFLGYMQKNNLTPEDAMTITVLLADEIHRHAQSKMTRAEVAKALHDTFLELGDEES